MTAMLAVLLVALSGVFRLVDSTGEPVRGATVRVVGGAASTARHAPSDALWWRLRAHLVASDDEPGPTEVETPAYEVVDLSAGFAFGKGFEVILSGSNLFDERYPVSPDADAPPAPGRSIGISPQARW